MKGGNQVGVAAVVRRQEELYENELQSSDLLLPVVTGREAKITLLLPHTTNKSNLIESLVH